MQIIDFYSEEPPRVDDGKLKVYFVDIIDNKTKQIYRDCFNTYLGEEDVLWQVKHKYCKDLLKIDMGTVRKTFPLMGRQCYGDSDKWFTHPRFARYGDLPSVYALKIRLEGLKYCSGYDRCPFR